MNRRDFLRLAGMSALSLAAGSEVVWTQEHPATKPNIIFIVADDLGYGDLGCYGQKRIKTPNLDKMASEGMRFTDFYAGSTVCAPSRCALMTGLHTGHSYIRGNRGVEPEGQEPLPADTVTLPGILKQAGYTNGCIGKWGLGGPGSSGDPLQQGFDFFFGYNCQSLAHFYYPDYLWRNDKKVELKGNLNGQKTTYSHDLMAREALNFITLQAGKPFFLYLPFTIPHAELTVPEDSLQHYKGQFEETPFVNTADKGYGSQPTPRAALAAMISRMDGDIGKIFELLGQLKIDDHTLVFFTSDNGPHVEGGIREVEFFNSNGPFRGAKRDVYEGGIRVPMIVRWPGQVKPGSVSSLPAAFWDVLPTLREVVKADAAIQTDGLSFLPELRGMPQPGHEYLYWEFHERGGRQAVRMGRWKGVRMNVFKNPQGPLELYDLEKDPGEQQDVAGQHKAIVDQIDAIMKEAHVESSLFPFKEKQA